MTRVDSIEIYKRTASCREWQQTEHGFVIETDGEGFAVDDPF